jgi:hypothetical protein
MAFTASTFSLVSYSGNGFHIWHYKSDDAAAVIDSAGYFNTFASEMNAGDVIFATTAASGTPVYGILVVSSNDGTTVDVNDMTAWTATDTD